MSQFNSIRNRGNYANAGRAAANNALRTFVAQRRSSPNYTRLTQKGAQLRHEEELARIKIKEEFTKRKVQIDTTLEANKIVSDAQKEADKNKRMAGKLAAAGQYGGFAMMKMGEKPLPRRDNSADLGYIDSQIEKTKAKMAQLKDGTSILSTSTNSNNTGDQQGGINPGKALEPTNISTFNPNITELDRQKLDIIGKYESDPVGGYNAINQIGIAGGRGVLGYSGDISKMTQHGGKSLTDFSVGQIIDLQADPGNSMSNADWIKSGKLHAVGRYQFIGPTLKSEVQRQGIDLNAKFTPQLQDQLALGYLNHVGSASPWVGPMDKATKDELNILNTF